MIEIIQPTKTVPFNNVEVKLYGKETGDWSMASIKNRLEYLKYAEQKGKSPEVFQKITRILKDANVQKAYAPWIGAWNRQIVDVFDFNESELLPEFDGVTIWRGLPAEGMIVPLGVACLLPTADCRTVVISHTSGKTIALHAGLQSLIPLEEIKRRANYSEFKSVIQNALCYFQHTEFNKDRGVCEEKFSPQKIQAYICCGIGWGNYIYHPEDKHYGETNARVINYIRGEFPGCASTSGEIATDKIIQLQLQNAGVPAENITVDDVDTFSDSHPDGAYTWHSNARERDLVERAKRNLVMVIRRD